MWQCSIGSGTVKVDEMAHVSQDHLDNNHTAIVEGVSAVYVWFGDKSPTLEQKIAMETAMVHFIILL